MKLVISKTRVIDENGTMLPWLNKTALDRLLTLKKDNWKVFEYGSGHSTVWWQDQVKEIVSVEHHPSFYSSMFPMMKENCNYIFRRRIKRKQSPYVNAIQEFDHKFDCIVIDGRDRNLCIASAIGKLKFEGIIILDNSERPRYKAGIDLLNENYELYLKTPIDNSKGISPFIWETTIWKNI